MTTAKLAADATPAQAAGVDVDALVRANLPLVKHIMHSVAAHFPRHADLDELAQAGALGLVEAAHRFDPSRGVPFESWAALRIRGAMLDSVRAIDAAPRAVRAGARQLEDARHDLAQSLGRMPSDDELGARLGMTAESIRELMRKVHAALVLSLDSPVGGDDPATVATSLGDSVVDDSVVSDPAQLVEANELQGYLRDAMAELPDRLRDVVEGYFFRGESSDAIAERLGVTTSRVSQMRTQGLTLMRAALEAQYAAPTDGPPRRLGVAERRQHAYVAAVASRSSYLARLSDVASPRFAVVANEYYQSG